MRLLVWGLLALAALSLAMPAQAAGFDCAKANMPVEKAICADRELSRLDREMAEKYRATYALLQGFDRHDLVRDQLSWLERRSKQCQFEAAKDLQDSSKVECLRRATRQMIDNIKASSELGRTVMLENDSTTQGLCSAVLAKRNIFWAEYYGSVDRYYLRYLAQDEESWEPVIVGGDRLKPANLKDPDFDFLNAGYANSVIDVSGQLRPWGLYGLLVVAPGEEEIIARRLAEALQNGDRTMIEKFAEDLRHKPIDQTDRFLFNGSPAASSSSAPVSPLKSYLIDPATTPIYGGQQTNFIVLSLGKTTYLLTQSVDNLGGPTGALFRPNSSGMLDLLCYHRAPRSHIKKVIIENFGRPGMCPIQHKQIPIDWQPPNSQNVGAIVFLKEWGGARPISKDLDGLNIGRPNAAYADESEVWRPLFDSVPRHWSDDTLDFMLTDKGGFVVHSLSERAAYDNGEPVETTYYHVEKNNLMPVCTVANEVIPPAGYPRQ